MNSIGELLKIADQLDESGDFESADEIVAIIQEMAGEKKEETPDSSVEDKKAWARRAVTTLVKVADSLEEKGAVKEAQMADQLLMDFQQTLPQGFNFGPAPAAPTITEEAPVAVQEAPAVVEEAPVAVEERVEVDGTPFTELADEKAVEEAVATEEVAEEPTGPIEVAVEEPAEPDPVYDEVTINEFKEMIEGMKWRHSQGPKRQKYEEILRNVEKANEYLQAYKEWSDYAHKMFEDEPIRIKFD